MLDKCRSIILSSLLHEPSVFVEVSPTMLKNGVELVATVIAPLQCGHIYKCTFDSAKYPMYVHNYHILLRPSGGI